MSLPRFFLEDQVLAAESEPTFPLRLSTDDAKHARVLRITPGEHIIVIDADQDCFECEVKDCSGDLPIVSIARHEATSEEGPHVILVQGLAKGDKMDVVIRQATELGVCAFIPLECERSVVHLDEKRAAKRMERWRVIAKSAAMQSGQPRIPEVDQPMGVAAACARLQGATALLVCWEEAPTTASLHDALTRSLAALRMPVADARIAVVVGPEGGLTQAEVDMLQASHSQAHLVSLGRSILRTETAGVIAPALALYELGCLGGA